MHIVFVIYGSIDTVSGGYLYDRHLIAALRRRGHSVQITDPSALRAGVGRRPDLYLIDELCHPHFYRRRHWRTIGDTPAVAVVHHLAAEERLGGWSHWRHRGMEYRFFSRIQYAVYASRYTRSSVVRWCRYYGDGVVALPGRAERPLTRPPPHNNTTLTMVYVGNIIRRKGLHHVLQCMHHTRHLPYRLEVVGREDVEPHYVRALKKQLQRWRLTDRVHFYGYLSPEKKEHIIRNSRVMVMPSTCEGFGISHLEAMAYGCIPIASHRSGVAEIIEHGLNGFLVDPSDHQKLSALIARLVNTSYQKEIAARVYARWQQHITWRDTFHTVIDHLEKIV